MLWYLPQGDDTGAMPDGLVGQPERIARIIDIGNAGPPYRKDAPGG